MLRNSNKKGLYLMFASRYFDVSGGVKPFRRILRSGSFFSPEEKRNSSKWTAEYPSTPKEILKSVATQTRRMQAVLESTRREWRWLRGYAVTA